MRYWIVTTEASAADGGGIGTYVQEMSAALAARGDEVVVIAANSSLTRPIKITDGPVRTVVFNPTSWTGSPAPQGLAGESFGASNVLRFLVGTLGTPDYLEFQDYGALAYFTFQRQLTLEPGFPRIPVIIRVHGPAFALRPYVDLSRYALPRYWVGEMERFCLEAADLVLSPSAAMDRLLKLEGVRASLVRAHNPMSLPASDPVPTYQGDLTYFGRVSAIKGILELLDALERRVAQGHQDRVSIIGGDSSYPVRATTMREFIDRRHARLISTGVVTFHGELPRAQALQELRTARAVLVPSRFESFGYAALEAMALRRVVVTGDRGAPGDFVTPGVNGLVCDTKTPAAFDAALDRAIGMSDDERAAIGTQAAATAQALCDPGRALFELDSALESLAPRSAPRTFPVVRPRRHLPDIPAEPRPAGAGLLSVVIPCFNLGEFVQQALDSVKASAYPEVEIIVIDDGSTDPATSAVIDALPLSPGGGPELRIIRTTNQGLARTRNTGADVARGEFLAFLDADDTVDPQFFSRAIDILRRYDNVGLVGCWLSSNDSGGWWETWNTELPFALFQNTLNSAGVVMRREVFQAHGRNNPDLVTGMEDYDSVLRMVVAGWHGVAIPQRLFHYRVRDGSMRSGFTAGNRTLMYERIAAALPEVIAEYSLDLIGLLNANGPGWARAINPTLTLTPTVSSAQ